MAYVKASERRAQLVVAARAVLCRDGVAGTTLRAVAAEAEVPLGTLHYVFPTKELLITAVLEDVRDEVSAVFKRGGDRRRPRPRHPTRGGELLGAARRERPRAGPDAARAVRLRPAHPRPGEPGPVADRGLHPDRGRVVPGGREQRRRTCAVPFDTLARVLVGSVMGIVLQYLSDHDRTRSQRDLQAVTEMLVRLADVHPARPPSTTDQL